MREGNTARYLRGHTSICSQQEGRCELGFQKRIAIYDFSLLQESEGTPKVTGDRPPGRT